METPVSSALSDAATALASFVVEKKASTVLLTDVVQKFNARASYAVQTAALVAYVGKFNELTALSDTLRSRLTATQEAVATWSLQLENLTDGQVAEMRASPSKFYCAGYLAVVNSLLLFDKAAALEVIDMMRADLIKDVNDAWSDFEAGVTPEIPRTAVVYESGHALELVERALADATSAESS